jgi:hypothetical protein
MTEQEKITITKYDLLYEQRMTRVETILEGMDKRISDGFHEMKTDFRWIVLIMLSGFGTLFTLIMKGMH